ncbi:MAG: AAA family ATPase [Blastocatellia bacterium]|nr:AAA family ATPase [Blastocatellia bacterium]
MVAYRFPTLVWEDYEGYWTARLVENDWDFRGLAGIAQTKEEALFQVKEYVQWLYQENPWRGEPDFLEPTLLNFRVDVRPEYKIENRIFPADEEIALNVLCVNGKQEGGILVASLPMLDIRFYFYDAKSLKNLVVTSVREKLKGSTPQQLSRFFPPKTVALEEISINAVRRARHRVERFSPEALLAIAEPLGDNRLRRQFTRAFERDASIQTLINRISEEKANVLLVGEPGAGKTSVLIDAARAIERHLARTNRDETDLEKSYKYKFWQTSGARLIAGMRYLGQWQERCETLIEELSNIQGVLCVENLLDLIRLGGTEPQSGIAAFLLPYLQRQELQLVAETTPAELDACRRLLPGFVEVCQIQSLPDFSELESINVLRSVATSLQQTMACSVPDEALVQTYRLFRRFQPYHAFPGRAVGFLREVVDKVSTQKRLSVTVGDAFAMFIRQTGLPELFLRDDIRLDETQTREFFTQSVIGQAEATEAALQVVTTFKAGLNDPQRPVTVMLLCGPTGVGKTELAKTLSRYFFGHGTDEKRLIRLDMSEYGTPGSAHRLITEPDGTPSTLIKSLRQQPFSLVLFDEIEKADAGVFDVLLSVFDEGRLTDRYGRVTNFRSAIIVLTSNLGVSQTSPIGFDEPASGGFEKAAMSFFRPEFFNRIDRVVQFGALSSEMIGLITEKELKALSQREGLVKANLRLDWTPAVVSHLARAGFDPRFGARPLQRAIEAELVAPLSRFLLAHPNLHQTQIRISLAEGKLCFEAHPDRLL